MYTLSIRSHSLKPTWSHVCEHAYAHVYKSTQQTRKKRTRRFESNTINKLESVSSFIINTYRYLEKEKEKDFNCFLIVKSMPIYACNQSINKFSETSLLYKIT